MARLRLLARDAGVARAEAGPAAVALTPRPGIALADDALSERNGRLIAAIATEAGAPRAAAVRELLERLAAA
jgi:transcription-repair coupling factor (superfamily II helicase)